MWAHFLGVGSSTPSTTSDPTTRRAQPELLDAVKEFQDSGYDVKALIRWIMDSHAYNLTSVRPEWN